jgi:hypothetical protein
VVSSIVYLLASFFACDRMDLTFSYRIMNASALLILRIEVIYIFSDSRSLSRSDWYYLFLRSWPISDHAKIEDPIISLVRRLTVLFSFSNNVAILYLYRGY